MVGISPLLKLTPLGSLMDVGTVVDHIAQGLGRLLGPSDVQIIADTIREGLQKYWEVADKAATAKLLEAHAALLHAFAAVRMADAAYLAASTLSELARADAVRAKAAAEKAQAVTDITELLRDLLHDHVENFSAIELPLVRLLQGN